MYVHHNIARSLGRRLVRSTLLASSTITSLLVAGSFYLDYRVEMKTLDASFASIQLSHSHGMSASLASRDTAQIKTQIDSILAFNDVVKVSIFDEKGLIYTEVTEDPKAERRPVSYLGLEWLLEGRRAVKIFALPDIKDPAREVGTLAIEASLTNMYVRLTNRAIYFALTEGIKTVLMVLVVLWLFRMLVTSHLGHVVDYLLQYNLDSVHDLEPLALGRIPPKATDELDDLVSSVNTLAHRLEEYDSRMHEQVRLKEQEVQDQKVIASNVAKLATLGEMAGGIAHEINNPLHIIKGYNDILVDQLGQGLMDRDVIHRASLVIDKNINRISKIVMSLLMFSQKGDAEVFEFINLPRLIDQVVSIMKPLAENHGIRFIVDLDGLRPGEIVECNQVQIAQVLINIINNAVDAIIEQGHQEAWVRVVGRSLADSVTIEIVDCGNGIDDDVAGKIFEPFFTTKEVGKGTGLGLSVSFGIIEQHSGRLYLDKNCPHTSFVLELPYRQHPDALKPIVQRLAS